MNLTKFYNTTIKICPVCEKPFLDNTKPKNKKYCSKQCKNKYKSAKRYEKATYKKWLPNDEYNNQKIKDKETINKRIFRQLLKEEEFYDSDIMEIILMKDFKQDDSKYGLGSAGNKLSEHRHPDFKKEYQLILETELAQGLITENKYYNKLKKFKI